MDDYLTFADKIIDSDSDSTKLNRELDVQLEEEAIVQFNNPTMAELDLATIPPTDPDATKKRPRDSDPTEVELIKDSGLYIKRPQNLRCSDIWSWVEKNERPTSMQNAQVWDTYVESMRLQADMTRWMDNSLDDLSSAIIGHALEV